MAMGDPPVSYGLGNNIFGSFPGAPGSITPINSLGIAGLNVSQSVAHLNQLGMQNLGAQQGIASIGAQQGIAFSSAMQGASLIPTNPVAGDTVTIVFDGVKWVKPLGGNSLPVQPQAQREIDTAFSLHDINAAEDFIEAINAGRAA